MSEWEHEWPKKCWFCDKRHPARRLYKDEYFARVFESASDEHHGKWRALAARMTTTHREDGSCVQRFLTVTKITEHESETEAEAAALAALDYAIKHKLTEFAAR